MSGPSLFSRGVTQSRKRPRPEDAQEIVDASASARAVRPRTEGQQQLVEADADVSFGDLGLESWLVETCAGLGIRSPMPVQKACIGPILRGRDVLGSAQTGSGKTAAFALPIIQRLAEDPYGVFAVVLTPSRELGFQMAEQFRALGSTIGVRVATLVGGMDLVKQAMQFKTRPHVIVATPGRLADHLTRGAEQIPLRRVQFLCLDEADRLMDKSFAPDMATIFQALPPASRRQTLLFSATMAPTVELTEAFGLTDPVRFDATPRATTVHTLREHYVFLPARVKLAYLYNLLLRVAPLPEGETEEAIRKAGLLATTARSSRDEPGEEHDGDHVEEEEEEGQAEDDDDDDSDDSSDDEEEPLERGKSAIIFVGTCRECQIVAESLMELGWLVGVLHSRMSQERRTASLRKFKSGLVPLLVATDVGSRGLDIPDVDVVVNYDVPRVPDDYIHRVGRTARAGRGGCAISLVTQFDVKLVHAIESKTGKRMTELPGGDISEEAVLLRLGRVSTAQRVARMRLVENGFEALLEKAEQRKLESKVRQRQFLHALEETETQAAKQASDEETDEKTTRKRKKETKKRKVAAAV